MLKELLVGLTFTATVANAQVVVPDSGFTDTKLGRELFEWTTFYAGVLQLGEWTVTLGFDSTGIELQPDGVAGSRTKLSARETKIYFNPAFVVAEPDYWRVVVHELLHVKLIESLAFSLWLSNIIEDRQAWEQAMWIDEELVQRLTALEIWPKPPEVK